MYFKDHYLLVLLITLIWSYYVQADVIYNLIGYKKKPASNLQPYQVEYVDFQQQCFAQCLHELKCYSFAIEKDNLSCHFYNISVPRQELVESPNTDYYTEFRNCQDWYNFGVKASGVYKINWMGRMMKDVRCNMEIDGGGWLTFQRRFDGSVQFYEPGSWDLYKNGFGSPNGEFWLGNDLLHEMTSSGDYYVLIVAESFDKESYISKYGQFHIDNENNQFQLHFNEYLLAGVHSIRNLNGQFFSTKDRDNDNSTGLVCTDYNLGGPFWHHDCYYIKPNGKYNTSSTCGMGWWFRKYFGPYFKPYSICMKSFEMMIKQM